MTRVGVFAFASWRSFDSSALVQVFPEFRLDLLISMPFDVDPGVSEALTRFARPRRDVKYCQRSDVCIANRLSGKRGLICSADVEQIYKELGKRVGTARDKANLTQERLAVRVGLSRTSIVNIEAGRQRVPLHQLYRIADALDLEPADLLPPAPNIDEEDRKRQWISMVTSEATETA